MKIVEYDMADPLGVLNLNLLSLDYALTPERVALIRELDRRPFPFFALYAIEDGTVAGQVGVYRLPVMTTEGPEEVGSICAMCTHPAFSRRGIAAQLMDEAHKRMLAAGLRFSTLGTARHRGAYFLYRKQDYEDVFIPDSIFATYNRINPHADRLRAERADVKRLDDTDDIFRRIAANRLGFARRQNKFLTMLAVTGDLNADDLWLFWFNNIPVGYAVAQVTGPVLNVSNLLLQEGVDAAEAIAALAQTLNFFYIRIRVDSPSVSNDLQRAGFYAKSPDWSVFMVKALRPHLTVEDARGLLGTGTQNFLISWMDVT